MNPRQRIGATCAPPAPSPAHKPSAIGLFRADLPRAFLAFGFLTLCVALAFVANRSPDSGPGPRSHVSSEAELSTGSMLVVSPAGSRCRESTIDNSTWQIRNKGWWIVRTRWQVRGCGEPIEAVANRYHPRRLPGRGGNSAAELPSMRRSRTPMTNHVDPLTT